MPCSLPFAGRLLPPTTSDLQPGSRCASLDNSLQSKERFVFVLQQQLDVSAAGKAQTLRVVPAQQALRSSVAPQARLYATAKPAASEVSSILESR